MARTSFQPAGRKTLLSKFLREYRKQNNLKQIELQEKLGYGRQGYISKIETGLIGTPDAEFLKALAREVGKTVDELIALSRQPEESEETDQLLPQITVPENEFKLVFGHSLWGAPIFHAAYEGRIQEFAVTSFASLNPQAGLRRLEPIWITPTQIARTPGPGVSDLAAFSAVDVLTLLRKGEADVGAVPGDIVPEDFIRIGTIVDSAAGCTFVCRKEKFEEWEKEGSHRPRRQSSREAPTSTGLNPMVFDTNDLCKIIENENDAGKKVRIGVEENTIAYEYLKDICEQDRTHPLQVKDVKWKLRSSELAIKSVTTLERECRSEYPPSDLIGVIVWEPHATWMTLIENAETGRELKKVPIHFTPSSLGRPHHLSYELVIRQNRIGRMNPREKELRSAVSKLMYELWDSANRLNKLSKWSVDHGMIEQLAEYFRFAGDDAEDGAIERTLNAVGSILYSVRWDVRGLSSLF
jgi:transcriptional regulator with XRE-family HTH domain